MDKESERSNKARDQQQPQQQSMQTAYAPTKCRITKPVPPRPAANPLQFVAVRPNPLLVKAQEAVKKVEIIKDEARKERKEEAEEWQSNLDNWKSSRRKRQEHIIERVEEVKKIELADKERASRRRGTTFSEILEKRKGGRFSIPLMYDNDANDLSDYGIGSSSSKADSIKDVDTDDNSSVLDEKEHHSSSNDESTAAMKPLHADATNGNGTECNHTNHSNSDNAEQYTYEGAIEDYRTRIRSKLHHVTDTPLPFVQLEPYGGVTKSKECEEAQSLLPKGSLSSRKKMFEMQNGGSGGGVPKSGSLGEDLMNAQSIKERLCALERCAVSEPKNDIVASKPTPNETRVFDGYVEDFRPPTSSSNDFIAGSSDREDSGIHTADVSCSVSQSDEPVEAVDVGEVAEPPNYRAITATFLAGEKEFADRNYQPPAMRIASEEKKEDVVEEESFYKMMAPTSHSPLVEHIAKTIDANEEEAQERVFDYYENAPAPFTLDSINDIFANPLSPAKLQPPTEKPPPPPPLAIEETNEEDLNANSIVSPSIRIKKEMLIKRSSFLGLEESTINEQLEQLALQEKQKEIAEQLQEEQLHRQLHHHQQQQQTILSTLPATNEEDEITKKEREIIELIEKEEKNKHQLDEDAMATLTKETHHSAVVVDANDIYLGNKKFDEPYRPEPCYDDDDQDSEVLKVEHELLQLEQEELKRQREQQLFHERAAAKLKAAAVPAVPLAATYENMYYEHKRYANILDTRKSMPDLQAKAMVNMRQPQQHHRHHQLGIPLDHRKSMPNLEAPGNNLLMPIQPLKPLERKDRYMYQHPIESDGYRGPQRITNRGAREPWIQPKANPAAKSYNQHWLYQEAELRRLADQRNRQSLQHHHQHHHHHVAPPPHPPPPPLLLAHHQADTKRVAQEMIITPKIRSSNGDMLPKPKDYVNLPYSMGGVRQQHAQKMPAYAPPAAVDHHQEQQDVILSVSGKKKCSYCSNELGRGAAMIIESLALCYHMECFKCCVCHTELGDGTAMGTDVRVRNQKLHCHNCYSSEDGIKFSCV